LARGAKAHRAVLGGQGLEILSDMPDRKSGYQHLLSNFGTAESGSQDWATENWIRKTGGDPVALLHILDTFVDTPREILWQISVPILVIAGVEDSERASADQLADLLPNGRYQAVPGNHISVLTNPQFIVTILDFLEAAL
jgi:pimeloyl-ACP methyl ester carboxylesterase